MPPIFLFVVDTCMDEEELSALKESLQVQHHLNKLGCFYKLDAKMYSGGLNSELFEVRFSNGSVFEPPFENRTIQNGCSSRGRFI